MPYDRSTGQMFSQRILAHSIGLTRKTDASAAIANSKRKNNQQKVQKMKTNIIGLLKSRFSRGCMLAAVLTATGFSLAWMGPVHYRLGGGWIGASDVGAWNALQVPLDSAGKTEAIRVSLISYTDQTAGLLAFSGANSVSDMTGEGAMTGPDTAKWTLVGYGLAAGNPPVIRQIWVAAGTLKFTGPDTFNNSYTLTVYPAEADADGDGFPDPGATPLVSIPGITGSAKRVPLPE